MFSHLSSWKSHKCVLKHLQQGTFFWDEQFEDHMPRSTLKMNVFQSISLETHKCVLKHCRSGLILLRPSIWWITCLGLLLKWMFSHLSPWKPINVCWNTQNRAHFAETINLRDHMPRFTLKMNVFPSISLETHKCVLKHSEQGSFCWDHQFEGSHA